MDQTTTPQLRPEAGRATSPEHEALQAYYHAHPPRCVGRANDRCARCGCPLVEAQREPVPTTRTWDCTAPQGDVFDVPAWHYEPGHGCERGHCRHPAPSPAVFDAVRQLQEAGLVTQSWSRPYPDLEAIRARAAAARWDVVLEPHVMLGEGVVPVVLTPVATVAAVSGATVRAFLATAREDVAALCDELAGAREALGDAWCSGGAPLAEAIQRKCAMLERLAEPPAARPASDWHEDMGPVLWWRFPVVEPPYAGTPLDSDWPDYVTHWTPISIPPDAAGGPR